MRFLLYNIRYGTGHGNGYHLPLPFAGFFKSSCGNLAEIVNFIQSVKPDIVGLIEVDSGSYRSGKVCQAKTISQALDYFHIVETKYGNSSLARKIPVMNKQSNALLTNKAIVDHRFHYFNEGVKRLVIEVELTRVIVFLVHLSLKFRHRQQQLESLHRFCKNRTKPMIIAGDFNTFWGSRELELFLAATNMKSANLDDSPSHPSHNPHRQLDFILHTPELQVTNFTIPSIQLSDHSPVYCDFSFR